MILALLKILFSRREHPDLVKQRVSQAQAIKAAAKDWGSTPVCPMCGMVNHERPFPVVGSGMCMRDDCPD